MATEESIGVTSFFLIFKVYGNAHYKYVIYTCRHLESKIVWRFAYSGRPSRKLLGRIVLFVCRMMNLLMLSHDPSVLTTM